MDKGLIIVKATPVAIKRGSPLPVAFQEIMTACRYHIAANIPLISTSLPDAVHQARVGMRRARSAVALFKPHLNNDARKAFNKELRTAGRLLGPCRDWDVFVMDMIPRLAKRYCEEQLRSLSDAAIEQRTQSYATLATQGERTLSGLRRTTPQDWAVTSEVPINTVAADLLDRMFFEVRSGYRHLDTEKERHTLRKAMKRLRYSVEFLTSLYDDKAVKGFLDHCRETQDILGRMNDACTMLKLSEKLPNEMRQPIIDWADHVQERTIGHLTKGLDDFRAAKPFWD